MNVLTRLLTWLEPDINKVITLEIGERKIAETGKHWKVTFMPWVRVIIGSLVMLGGFTWDLEVLRWLLVLLGVALIGQALYRILFERRDRFVVTNQRVFRVWGVLHVKRVTVPLLRILDITVDKPLLGRWLNYGHLVFKSAAEVEGLALIDHVPNIDRLEAILRACMNGQAPLVEAKGDGT
jgi:membrane protein YdbS with pleckstrin-like domain